MRYRLCDAAEEVSGIAVELEVSAEPFADQVPYTLTLVARGMPVARVSTPDGAHVYTLYATPRSGAFVHALDTRARTARCIDIPDMTDRAVMAMRLRMADGGGRLVIVAGAKPVAAIDTRTLALVPAREHLPPAPPPSSGSSTDAWAIGALAVLLAAAGLVGVRRWMPHNPAHGGRS